MAYRYFWLKLTADFFNGEDSKLYIDRIRETFKSQGDTAIVIFIKMMLLSLNTEGILTYKGIFNTLEEEIANILCEDLKNIEFTIKCFLKTPLLEERTSESKLTGLFMPYVVANTGSKTDSALRMEKARAKAKIEVQNYQLLETSQCAHNVTLDKNIREEFKDNYLKKTSQCDAIKTGYGYHQNVYLSEEEYAYICNTYAGPNKILDDVSYWIKEKDAKPESYFSLVQKFIAKGKYTRLDDPERLKSLAAYEAAEKAYLSGINNEEKTASMDFDKLLDKYKALISKGKEDK